MSKQEPCSQWKNSKQQVIRYEEYRMTGAERLRAAGKGMAVCGLFAAVFYRSMKVFWMMVPVGVTVALVAEKKRLKNRRMDLLAAQFKESMVILASALSSGYAMENALAVSREELSMLYGENGLITGEFSYMMAQLKTNRTIEEVLNDFAERSGLEDVKNFSEVFSVAKRSGGDLSGIMRHTAEVIRDKMQVREEIRTMTASRQFEQRIMGMIPFLIVFYVEGSSPGFFSQMYETGLGRILMTGCMTGYLISVVLSRRILDIRI